MLLQAKVISKSSVQLLPVETKNYREPFSYVRKKLVYVKRYEKSDFPGLESSHSYYVLQFFESWSCTVQLGFK